VFVACSPYRYSVALQCAVLAHSLFTCEGCGGNGIPQHGNFVYQVALHRSTEKRLSIGDVFYKTHWGGIGLCNLEDKK
jgi:hypothetical protein